MSYFKVEEFLIDGKMPSTVIVNKIKRHIAVMDIVREKFGKPIRVSSKSGYRSVSWELAHGRTGTSQHTYSGAGAADYTADDLEGLLEALIEHSTYTRICLYPKEKFIHCDFVGEGTGVRKLFTAVKGKWIFKENIK